MNMQSATDHASTLQGFKRLKKKDVQLFNSLDWNGVERNIIDELFPIKRGKYGHHPHPPSYLTSTSLAEQWRKLSNGDQQFKIDQWQNEEVERVAKEKKAASRSSRSSRRRRGGEDPPRTPPKQVTTKKRARRGKGTPDSAIEYQEEDSNQSGDINPLGRQLTYNDPPPEIPNTTMDITEEIEMYSTECRGISRFVINESAIKDKDKVTSGYSHIIGNVHRWMSNYLSNNNGEWPYGQHVAGYLMNPNAKDNEQYSWLCTRIVEEDDDGDGVKKEVVRFSFTHRQCTGEVEAGGKLCKGCKKNQYSFYTMCRHEVDKQKEAEKNPLLGGRHDYKKFYTPTIMMPYINALTKQITVLRTKLWRAEMAKAMMRKENIDATNVDHDILFDEQMLREGYAMFQQEFEVSERQMMDVLFQECLVVRRRMKERGNAKGHIYTPLMIRFAIMLKKKLSQSNYDFIRQVFGLPTNGTLCQYTNADTTAEDGLMHETCMQQAQWMKEQKIPLRDFKRYVGLSFDSHTIRSKIAYCPHTKRIVGFAQDAFDKDVIIEEFKRMGEQIEEEEDDCVEEDEEGEDDDDAAENNKKNKNKLAEGKHYYVFIVQSLSSKGPPIRFIAARYCVANLSHRWLRAKLEYIESALAFYGVIVCAESFDGATENRSCMKHRTTLTFEDVCGKKLKVNMPVELASQLVDGSVSSALSTTHNNEVEGADSSEILVRTIEDSPDTAAASTAANPTTDSDCLGEFDCSSSSSSSSSGSGSGSDMEGEDDGDDKKRMKRYHQHELPWKMKIAFNHPSMKGLIIVAAGDMGHGVKKMRNAMDLSGKEDKVRDLHHNGLPVNLKMAEDVWRLTPDADPKRTSTLMLYPKLSLSVFCPSSKSAMRTSDATRAQGNSMMEMLMDYGHLNHKKAGPRAYDSLILHCANTDLWVNVMNGTPKKGCETIKSAHHRHIYDLCDYVAYLTKWKDQVKDKNEFFPISTYEDICWTSLGTVAVAQFYLPKHPEHDLIQSRLSSDPCESTFMLKRNANPNADKMGTDHILASVHGGPLMQLWASKKGNVEKKRVFFGNELMLGKFKRNKLKYDGTD